MKSIICITLLIFALNGLSWAKDIKPGIWRFEIKQTMATIPFLVEFKYNGKRLEGVLYNGKEMIDLRDIVYSLDTLTIPLQLYEATLNLNLDTEESITGEWVRHNKNPKQSVPVKGTYGISERFPGTKKATNFNMQGKWSMTMKGEGSTTTPAVGIFEQTNNYVSGSILTQSGDYRFIEGYISDSDIEMASFDGVYNFLLKGSGNNDTFTVEMLSSSKTTITAFRNADAKLPDAFAQTQLDKMQDWSFPDDEGKIHSLASDVYKNKAVIIQIFGSWCPNCMDETKFMIPWYLANKNRGVEVVALAFERSLTALDAKRQISRFRRKMSVPYPLLIAGSTADVKPDQVLTGLKNFISFPTTIFLNKKHEVYKVHAGFSGPATGVYFEEYKKEFNQTVDHILK